MHTELLLEEIEAGQGETLTRAARRLPRSRGDRPVTLGCLVRWVTKGVTGPTGHRITLEAARLAGRWVTTPAAIRRFVEAQNLPADAAPVPRSPCRRRRENERAKKDLERAGF